MEEENIYECWLEFPRDAKLSAGLRESLERPGDRLMDRASSRLWLAACFRWSDTRHSDRFYLAAEDGEAAVVLAKRCVLTLLEYEDAERLMSASNSYINAHSWTEGAVILKVSRYIVQPVLTYSSLHEDFRVRLSDEREQTLLQKERAEYERLKAKFEQEG